MFFYARLRYKIISVFFFILFAKEYLPSPIMIQARWVLSLSSRSHFSQRAVNLILVVEKRNIFVWLLSAMNANLRANSFRLAQPAKSIFSCEEATLYEGLSVRLMLRPLGKRISEVTTTL